MNHRRLPFLALAIAIACTILASTTVCGAATRVPLVVRETASVARLHEPVTFGVPIPKGELADARHARLLLHGKEVPAQFRVTGLWRPGKRFPKHNRGTGKDTASQGMLQRSRQGETVPAWP